MIDFALDINDDLMIEDGDFAMRGSLDQDVSLIIRLAQGDLKEDPILGAGLIRLINANATAADIKARMKLHLERDGKNYEEFKNSISIN